MDEEYQDPAPIVFRVDSETRGFGPSKREPYSSEVGMGAFPVEHLHYLVSEGACSILLLLSLLPEIHFSERKTKPNVQSFGCRI